VNNSDQSLMEKDSGYTNVPSAGSPSYPEWLQPSVTYLLGTNVATAANLPVGFTPNGFRGTLSNVNALGHSNVLGSNSTLNTTTVFYSYSTSPYFYNSPTQYLCWDGTVQIVLPQSPGSTSPVIYPVGVNGLTQVITTGGTTQTNAATQVIGTDGTSGYIWQLNPPSTSAPSFANPQILDSLVASYTASNTPSWSQVVPSSINDSGALVGTATYTQQNSSDPIAAGQHGVILLPAELAVDADRNGTIVLANENPSGTDPKGNPVDQTTQLKPFRFWINNDEDSGTANPNGSDVVSSTPTTAVSNPDCNAGGPVSIRDLEDWTRLWMYTKGLNQAIHDGTIKVGLKWKNITRGNPSIRVQKSVSSNGDLSYLGNFTDAQAQVDIDPLDTESNGLVSPTSNAADYVFRADGVINVFQALDDETPITKFIFEGVTGGAGQLEIVFLKSDGVTKIGEGGNLWLDLRDIKEMYLRAIANPAPPKSYSSILSQPPSYFSTPPSFTMSYAVDNAGEGGNSGTFVPDPNEDTSNPTYIVFVHGFNMSPAGSTNYAETMYKRLWQLGYKGRFASFRWPTLGNGASWTLPVSLPIVGNQITYSGLGIYNDCEYIAYNSGAALKKFVSDKMSGYHVDMFSHSLGSVVAGEALREGMTVQYYAMSHAAASASLYGTGSSYYPITDSSVFSFDNDSDAVTHNLAYSSSSGGGYTGYFGGISTSPTGGIINFSDSSDPVITTVWNFNNNTFKPQALYGGYAGQYNYDSSQPSGRKVELGYVLSGEFYDWRYVTQSDESKAYVDRSLTSTVGRMTTAAGSISVINTAENLSGDHGYEFDNPIQDPTTFSFYNALMGRAVFNLNPISIPTSP
jgi:pimeloyl-ACP methyl ester carboxylesterase